MSRFIKIFISSILLSVFCFALIAEEKTSPDTSPEHLRQLIQNLSSGKFADRDHATKDLIRMGYYARDEVKKALNSKDPEVKMRLKEIWDKIQWCLFPEASKDDAKTLSGLAKDAILPGEWDDLTKKYGPRIIMLFSELNYNPDYQNSTVSGLISLLTNSTIESLADYITKSPSKAKLEKMLLGFRYKNISIANREKLQALFFSLGLKKEAVMTASLTCWKENDIYLTPEVIGCFRDPNLASEIFKHAQGELNGAESSIFNDWTIVFFAKIAKDMNQKRALQGFLKGIDYNLTNQRAITFLAQILISISLYDEAIESLSGTHSPVSIYLRSVAFNNSGDKNRGKKLMDLLNTKLTNEKDLYIVGEEMNRFKDPRAVKVWEKILEMAPGNSIYDSNARIRLSACYEGMGEYGKAADLLEKGLSINEEADLFWDENQLGAVEEALKNRIANLREMEKGGGEIWLNAVTAMKNKEYVKALEGFNKFLEKNPNFPWAYYKMTVILESQEEYEKAIPYIEKAIKLLNKDKLDTLIDFSLKKVFLISMQQEYDKAIGELKRTLELDPANSQAVSMLAMNTYYKKDYKKAAELYAKDYELDPDHLYTKLWIYICLSKMNQKPNPDFANFAEKLIGNKWPIPIIKYYNSSISIEKLLDTTFDIDKERENEKKCEAYYFIGEFLLLNKKKKEAKEYFQKCIKCNLPIFRENISSEQRLQELK